MGSLNWSRILPAAFAALLVPAAPAQTGLISTVAGTGYSGTGGVGGLAVNAQLNGAAGLAVDRFDNLFLAEPSTNRVLRIDASSGILTLVAGNGAGASTGDGGPAAQASVYQPYGVAVDAAGNLLIAESGAHRIRRIDAQTGIITTVVGTGYAGFSNDGGAAAGAALNFPMTVALDAAGNLYIGDSGNARVRRVDAQTGIITTVAGNGVSAFSPDGVVARNSSLLAPFGMSLDRSGAVLISEPNSGRIRRVNGVTGLLETVAGNGSSMFNGDAIPAASAAIGASTGGIGINVASDPAGNLYFADGTGRIRRVDAATGLIGSVAGSGKGAQGRAGSSGGGGGCNAGPLGDGGPAATAIVDGGFSVALTSGGNVLFSDWIDCRVRRVYLPSPYPYTTTAVSVSPSPVGLNQPVKFTATVTPVGAAGIPSGTVEFVVQVPNYGSPYSVSLGLVQVVNGAASLTITAPSSPGSWDVVGYYSGDAAFTGSGSPRAVLTVADTPKVSPTVTLSSTQNPVDLDTSVSFTARVVAPAGNPNQPTGAVYFFDGSVQIGMAPLVGGWRRSPHPSRRRARTR